MKRREISFSSGDKEICGVSDCSKAPKRSIPRKRVEKVSILNLRGSNRKVPLCSDCYRIFKKETKKERAMESLGR